MKFKKNCAALLASVIAAAAFPANLIVYAEGENVRSGNYVYSVNEDGTITFENYKGTETEVKIPDTIDGKTVVTLGAKAFADNTTVKSVALCDSISSIDYKSFLGCTSLEKIEVNDTNKNYDVIDGVLYNEGAKQLLLYPVAKSGSEFVIPDTVDTIGKAAMYETSLEKITFPASLTYIEHHGVSYNSKLKEADLSGTAVDELGDLAFTYCTALEDVKLSDKLEYIGSAAFAGCSSLEEIDIPFSVITIGQNAFAGTAMKSVIIPSTVQEIGYCAFGYDEELKPISDFVIYGVSSSMAHTYAKDVDQEYDYENDFEFISINEIDGETGKLRTKKDGVVEYAIDNDQVYIVGFDTLVADPVIPSEIEGLPVTRIYMGAFFTSVAEKIVIPDTVKVIDKMAFTDCSKLKEIVIPEGVEIIGDEVFAGCSSLEKITIPASVKEIGKNLFDSCTMLAEIEVAEGNTILSSDKGILFDKNKETLIRYPYALKAESYKIPDGVKKIGGYAFLDVKNLKSVELNKVTEIAPMAFCGCSNIKEMKIPETVTKIDEYAFYDCTGLKSIRLHDKLQTIGKDAFGYVEKSDHSGSQLLNDFKIFADKGSKAETYAKENHIECVTGSIEVLGKNINKGFFGVIIAAVVALIAFVLSKPISKSIKNKKAEKAREESKKNADKNIGEDPDNEEYESILDDDKSDSEEK